MTLPPLPEPALPHSRLVTKDGVFGKLYNETQLIEYGKACAEAMREACAVEIAASSKYAGPDAAAIRALEIET